MKLVIFLVHLSVVMGVPFVCGWLVLRYLVRERNVLVLVPGAVMMGCALLMVLVNQLRHFTEMKFSLWVAYQIFILAAVLIRIGARRHPIPLFLPKSCAHPVSLAAIAGAALFCAAFFGVPASSGLLNDAWWFHYPAATLIQTTEQFPLSPVFAPDDPLYYHFGPDILAATWSFLLDLPVQKGFAINIWLLSPVIFLLGFSLVLRCTHNFVGAMAGGLILMVGGNIRFVALPFVNLANPVAALQVLNSQTVEGLLELLFTPSHLVGIPLSLLCLHVFHRFRARQTWSGAGVLGFCVGALTLVAEWYFFPLIAGLGLYTLFCGIRRFRRVGKAMAPAAVLSVAPLLVAFVIGVFDNTYVSGFFGHFWMRHGSFGETVQRRQFAEALERSAELRALERGAVLASNEREAVKQAWLEQDTKNGFSTTFSLSLRPKERETVPPWLFEVLLGGSSDAILRVFKEDQTKAASAAQIFIPSWQVPDLVPLHFNIAHFGFVPSWESAGSSMDTFVPILGLKFLGEAFPVLVLGLPFGIVLWIRTKQPVVFVLAVMAWISIVPPIALEWGYRSTDFLRFFTGAFSFSALFVGALIGWLWARRAVLPRAAAVVLTSSCLLNAAGIGVLGLMPGTLETVQEVTSRAGSLSELTSQQSQSSGGTLTSGRGVAGTAQPTVDVSREQALENLSGQLENFLYPLTRGRDRAVVIVPVEKIPPLEVFPEWMKLQTLSKVVLPLGWYWEDSPYAALYRRAVSTLDEIALASLDAKWIVVTNLWDDPLPEYVSMELKKSGRFLQVRSFAAGQYYLDLYRVL